MSVTEMIENKRDGGRFSELDIAWLIGNYTRGEIPDYQMAALLMAIYWQGLDSDELAWWTEAMLHSGDVLDFSDMTQPKVDKHSTGGIGDKVSIVLGPLAAACGVVVPMMSGRGLGHTGGTVDKLESIPGFKTALGPDRFTELVRRHGIVLAGQSVTLVPADRLIYALRDTTGTVPSIPLIASSIMSKKLAEGLDALVLDVKVGSGAFMKDEESARLLAETMVGIGRSHDTKVVALLTAMDQPLGNEVGNANEIVESIAMLKGEGPDDLVEIVYRLGVEMLIAGGITQDPHDAMDRLAKAISNGAALNRFGDVIEAQGGDRTILEDTSRLPQPTQTSELTAPRAGVVTRCDALAIGHASVRLGAGRALKEDDIDPAVGFTILAKVGDEVGEGDVLARIGWNDRARLETAMELLERAWEIGDGPAPDTKLVIGEVR